MVRYITPTLPLAPACSVQSLTERATGTKSSDSMCTTHQTTTS